MRTYFLPTRIPESATKAEAMQIRLFNLIVDMSLSEDAIIPVIHSYLNIGANPDYYEELSLLAVALRQGRYRVMRTLLERGARLDLLIGDSEEMKRSVFHLCMGAFKSIAGQTGEAEGLRLLLQYDTKYQFYALYGSYPRAASELLTDFLNCLKKSPFIWSEELSAAQRKQLISEINELAEAHLAAAEAARSRFSLASMASRVAGFFSRGDGYAPLATETDEARLAKKTA